METAPYYPQPIPNTPPWRWLTPEFFAARESRLALPGARVVAPNGKTWDPRAVWNGGEGGPPQGSLIVVPDPR